MKIKIKKRSMGIYFVISATDGPVDPRDSGGRVVDFSPSLVRELMRFQITVQEVQKLLHTHYEGKFEPSGRLQRVLERLNDSHNRRTD